MKTNRAQASFTRQSLLDLLARAYRVETFQVSGPDWLNRDKFDIAAKLPDGSPPTRFLKCSSRYCAIDSP